MIGSVMLFGVFRFLCVGFLIGVSPTLDRVQRLRYDRLRVTSLNLLHLGGMETVPLVALYFRSYYVVRTDSSEIVQLRNLFPCLYGLI